MKMVSKLIFLVAFVSAVFIAGCGTNTNSNATPTSQNGTAPSDAGNEFINKFIKDKGVKKDGKQLVVAVDVSDMLSEYMINAEGYIRYLLEQSGAKVISNNSNNDLAKQDSNVSDYIQMGVDAVILMPVDSKSSATYLKRLNDAHIPVITIIKQIDGAKMDLFVSTSDNVQAGEKAAKWLLEKANGSELKIATVQGTMTQSDAYLREEGITNITKANTNLKLVSQNPSDWLPEKAASAINDALTAHPDLGGIITHCDCMSPGVTSALKQANHNAKVGEPGHIYWAGIDGAPYGLEQIRNGTMDVAIEQSPLSVATIAVKGVLTKVAQGLSLNEEKINLSTRLITKKNVDDPANWGNFDIKSKRIWINTQETWDSFLK